MATWHATAGVRALIEERVADRAHRVAAEGVQQTCSVAWAELLGPSGELDKRDDGYRAVWTGMDRRPRMNDKPTAELKADLREQRQWLANNPRDFRAGDYRRRISQLEADLETRGEALEPERPDAPTRRKIYDAQHRVQMTAEGWMGENTLSMHEDRGDGTALCGQGLNDWTDPKTGKRWRSVWLRHGPGPVDCGKCANVSGEPTGYEPLAEPQGVSVRTVSGGAYEMNRRRH